MTDAPRRIQLSRAKGWRMPAGAVRVSRPSLYGNPWTVARARAAGFTGSDAEVAALCALWFDRGMRASVPICRPILAALPTLRGKTLACWCRLDRTCHADTLLAMANAPLACEAA